MTAYDVAQAMVRRWWVLVMALVATAVFALSFAPSSPVYWARYNLNLVAPDRSGAVYSRTSAPSGVTPMAGILVAMLGGNHPEPQAATQSAPIFGLRDRTGVEVLARDKGSQWSRDYVAALQVQIAEPSTAEVNAQAASLAKRARAALTEIQDQQGVARATRITLEEPSAIEVVEVFPARTRAIAGAVILGTALSLVLTVTVDRWLLRRSRSRAQVGRPRRLNAAEVLR